MNVTAVPIEFLGWSILPVINIGDIAAIVALILSPMIFWIGYRRRMKSDELRIRSNQLQISLELMDRILTEDERLDAYLDRTRKDSPQDDYEEYSETKHLALINDVLTGCDYFGYVIDEKEIDRAKVIRRYSTRIFEIWRDLNIDGYYTIERLDKRFPNKQYPLYVRRLINRHYELIKSVMEYWQRAY